MIAWSDEFTAVERTVRPKYHPVTFLNAVDAVDSIGVKMFHMDEADSLFERKDVWMY